jgi:ABC-2 type transport system ATP-binding protein
MHMAKSSRSHTADDTGNGAANWKPSVAVEDLSLTYSDGTEAVKGMSLSIPKGEFFGFLGPNGAGKTTTIKMLATLLEPTDGTVRINGYDATSERTAVRGTIGYMAQEISVDEELTARENLRFACEAYGVARAHREDRIDELLDLVDLADVSDTPAEQFSGGMKKRLDAATALVHDPELVFLDEPTTGLDPKARNRLWAYFERINENGTTIFLTTQYLEEADALCDRLAVIRDGTLVEDGSPDELKRRVGGEILEIDVDGGPPTVTEAADIARNSDLFEADVTIDTTEDSLRVATQFANYRGTERLVALQDAGIYVTGFDIEEASLDDVFLAIADDQVDDLEQSREGSA